MVSPTPFSTHRVITRFYQILRYARRHGCLSIRDLHYLKRDSESGSDSGLDGSSAKKMKAGKAMGVGTDSTNVGSEGPPVSQQPNRLSSEGLSEDQKNMPPPDNTHPLFPPTSILTLITGH